MHPVKGAVLFVNLSLTLASAFIFLKDLQRNRLADRLTSLRLALYYWNAARGLSLAAPHSVPAPTSILLRFQVPGSPFETQLSLLRKSFWWNCSPFKNVERSREIDLQHRNGFPFDLDQAWPVSLYPGPSFGLSGPNSGPAIA